MSIPPAVASLYLLLGCVVLRDYVLHTLKKVYLHFFDIFDGLYWVLRHLWQL